MRLFAGLCVQIALAPGEHRAFSQYEPLGNSWFIWLMLIMLSSVYHTSAGGVNSLFSVGQRSGSIFHASDPSDKPTPWISCVSVNMLEHSVKS